MTNLNLGAFLQSILDSGRAEVVTLNAPLDEDIVATRNVLIEFESIYRDQLPRDVPTFAPDAALWAAKLVYRAGQCILYREIEAQDVKESLQHLQRQDTPNDSAQSHYSVDVVFRFLPDLLRFANSVAQEDPVAESMLKWCKDWPLSSVGVDDVGEVNDDGIVSNSGLLTIYVNRIIDRQDTSRIESAAVQQKLKEVAGAYPHLLGDAVRRKLWQEDRDTSIVPSQI